MNDGQEQVMAPSVARRDEVIGEVIKNRRIKLGLTADQLGEKINVSRSRVYMWEAESYVFPKNLKPLSDALGIPLKRLQQINGSPR